jgi:hypothetical protein
MRFNISLYSYRLFQNHSYNDNGLYGVWLNCNGEWKHVLIDDYFPCKNGEPVFSSSKGLILWVILMEKAYAKVKLLLIKFK